MFGGERARWRAARGQECSGLWLERATSTVSKSEMRRQRRWWRRVAPNESPCATMPSQCPSNCVVTSPLVGQLRRKQVKANCFLSIALLDCSFLPVGRQMCYGHKRGTPGNPLYFGNVLHSLAPVRQLFSGCRDNWRCSFIVSPFTGWNPTTQNGHWWQTAQRR